MRTQIFGFEVESDFDLPCANVSAHPCSHVDRLWNLEVEFRPRPDWDFSHATPLGRRGWGCAYDVGDGIFIGTKSGVSFLFRRDGERVEISFDPCDSTQVAQAGVWMANMGMAICHLLRGAIPLHGASVQWNGRLFGLMADSGTGKSTLLWRLLDAGALFCADDLLPIHWQGETALATPSMTLHGKLSGDALNSRGLAAPDFVEIVPGADEFWMPIEAARRTVQSQKPSALFILSPYHSQATDPAKEPLFLRHHIGGEAISLLLANTHGLWATCGLLDARTLMGRFLQIAQEIPVFTLHYPRDITVLPALRQMLCEVVSDLPV